jgi:hypothetical protein
MNYKFILFFLFALGASFIHAAPPIISYSGKVSVDGQPFTGTGLFKFAILNAENNASLWSNDGTSVNGSQPSASVGISVNGGLYSILLGNNAISAMGSIDPTIFLQHNDTRLRIWFSDGQGFEQLTPDRPFASVPYALNAKIAPGSIENQHLSPAVRADLNTTVSFPGTIISVPVGQNPPPGYSLHRTAEPNPFVWYKASDIDIHNTNAGYGKTIGLNSKLYYLCGDDSGSDPGKLCSVYDPNTDQWTPIAPSNYTSEFPGAIIHDGKIYLLNGKYLEIYDPASNTWQVGPTMPTTESPENFGYTKLNGKIWAFGGVTGTSYSYNPLVFGYFYSFDLSNNTWQDESSSHSNDSKYFAISSSLFRPKVLSYSGKMWVISPRYGNILLNNISDQDGKVYSFDPDSKSWKMETVLPVANISAAWSNQGKVFASQSGNIGSIGRLTNIFVFDEFSRSWKEFAHLPRATGYTNVAIVDERIFLTGFSTNDDSNYYANLNDTFRNLSDLYIKDGNASAGVPTVQAEVADGHVTTNKLFDGSVTSAKIAPNSVDHPHLSPAVRADLNRTITKSLLSSDILNDLNATIDLERLSPAVRSDLNRTITKSMLGSDVLGDLNRTITKNMLSSAIQNELNASSARVVGASLTNPYGSQGTFVFTRGEYTVPQNKVMVVTSVGHSLKVLDMFTNFSPVIRASNTSTVAIVPSGARISSSDANKSISGLLFSSLPGIEPIIGSVTYKVPLGKTLVITSSSNEVNANLDNDLVRIRNAHDPATFVTMGTTVSVPHANYRWSGYLIDQTNDAPRYWRMVIADQDSSGWEAYVYEMQLKDKDDNIVSGPNLGTAQTSTKRNQTETTPGIFDASMVFDGSESTFLQTEFGNGKLGKWISYTFNQGQWIHAIRVKGYSGASNSIPSWHIEYSMDNGSSWTKAWTATNMGALWKEDSF